MGRNDGTGRQIESSEYPGRLKEYQGVDHFVRRYSAVPRGCACGSETSAFMG